MIGKLGSTEIFAYCEPVGMRKGFEGLAGLGRNEMNLDPLSGGLFLFTNRRGTDAKILLFDGTGMCIYAKRLERGRFGKLWRWASHRRLSTPLVTAAKTLLL